MPAVTRIPVTWSERSMGATVGHIGAIHRIKAAFDLLRPRTFFRTLARVDHLVDDARNLKTEVDQLKIKIEQLASIERLNWEQRRDHAQLDHELDPALIGEHVAAAVNAATIEM